jgi:hypothetical protein
MREDIDKVSLRNVVHTFSPENAQYLKKILHWRLFFSLLRWTYLLLVLDATPSSSYFLSNYKKHPKIVSNFAVLPCPKFTFLCAALPGLHNLALSCRPHSAQKCQGRRICHSAKQLSNLPIHIINKDSRESSVGITLGYGLDDRGSRVRSPGGGLGIFLFTTASRTALGAHPASYTMGTRCSFPGVKPSEREADHSPPSSAEIKECVELYLHLAIRPHGVVPSEAQGQLHFALIKIHARDSNRGC